MQLSAYRDLKERSRITVFEAERGREYFCIECQGEVRLRTGSRCRAHFYHLSSSDCSLRGKGAEHIAVQKVLQHTLGLNYTEAEYPFPSIGRIADVAYFPQKLIFEVQCSPISVREVEARIADYNSLGWQVIWILHLSRFGGVRGRKIKNFLRSHPHYFTNLDSKERGGFFDRYVLFDQNRPIYTSPLLPLHCLSFHTFSTPYTQESALPFPCSRKGHWKFFCRGDAIDQLYYRKERGELERTLCSIWEQRKGKKRGTFVWSELLKRGREELSNLFYFLLEGSVRK